MLRALKRLSIFSFLERCQQVLLDVDEMESAVTHLQTEPRGLLKISAPPAIGATHIARAVAEFLKIQGPIFLDEPSSAAGDVYTERLGKLLTSLSERFKRQIIIITHSEKLASFAEKQYLVYKESNISKVKELTNDRGD